MTNTPIIKLMVYTKPKESLEEIILKSAGTIQDKMCTLIEEECERSNSAFHRLHR